jgi:hypothetical protein
MEALRFRKISPENEKSVRDFFRDAKNLAPEDIEKFLGGIERHAGRLGGLVNIEKSDSNDALGIELWLGHMGAVSEARRIFAVRRQANEIRLGKSRRVLCPSGPYYLCRDITPIIQPYAVLITPAIMNTEPGNLIEVLKNIRIIKQGRDSEKVKEAKYDLYAACSGTRIGFVDLFSGERLDILGA